jgi:hypothetical protein
VSRGSKLKLSVYVLAAIAAKAQQNAALMAIMVFPSLYPTIVINEDFFCGLLFCNTGRPFKDGISANRAGCNGSSAGYYFVSILVED